MDENCRKCKKEAENTTIPYALYESSEMRHERREKRYIWAIIISILLLTFSNMAWLFSWMQYDYSSEEIIYQQDGQGTNIIGENNEVNNGAESNNSQTEAD